MTKPSGGAAVTGLSPQLIIDSVRDYAIFALDVTGHVVSWNTGAERAKGYVASEIVGKHISVFYPPEDVASGKPQRLLSIALKDGRVEDEGWRVRKDGSRFWADVIIVALRDETGTHLGFAKVTRDLTEREMSQQKAIADARRIAEAEAANKAKTEFLAAMSHELRTPLNAIGGFTELIEVGVAGDVTEHQRGYLRRIRAAQQHLLALISDLLNYSRIEAGQISYDIEPVALGPLIERVVAMLESQALNKQLTLEHTVCSPNAVAMADRMKVEQIVLNLLSNAIKFTPPYGSIKVDCSYSDAMTFISVIDTGPGIPPDKQHSVFEPFVQLGRSLTQTQEGTGLGLAISRDLARAMDGDVTLSSVPRTGSTFTLTLRRA